MSKLLVSNKKAFFNYEILDKYECGISLKGPEVKSVIKSSASLDEAFCIIRKQELFIINMYIGIASDVHRSLNGFRRVVIALINCSVA